jgi:hypothetical protein
VAYPSPGIGGGRPAEKVLYFDFELSAAQFKKRYSSDLHGNYQFGPGFTRLVFNPEATGDRKFATYAFKNPTAHFVGDNTNKGGEKDWTWYSLPTRGVRLPVKWQGGV